MYTIKNGKAYKSRTGDKNPLKITHTNYQWDTLIIEAIVKHYNVGFVDE